GRFVVTHAEAIRTASHPGRTGGGAALHPSSISFRRTIHETIAKATQDIERDFHFNTAISAVMELVNALYAFEAASHDGMPAAERAALLREAVEITLLLLGPIAPHVTEELWSQLGHTESLFTQPWHIKTVAVPIFLNRTQEPGVDSIITKAVAQAFATNGRLRVVRPADADAILEGEITNYGVAPIAYDPALNIQLYRLVVVLN